MNKTQKDGDHVEKAELVLPSNYAPALTFVVLVLIAVIICVRHFH